MLGKMKTENGSILIFGGTTEGRTAAEELLAAGVPCTVSVATQYGEEVLKPFDYAKLCLATSISMDNLKVVSIYTTDNEESKNDGAMTLTCKVGSITVDVRTGVLKDAEGNVVTEDYFKGKTIDVKGIIDCFQGTYQIKVFSLNDIVIH